MKKTGQQASTAPRTAGDDQWLRLLASDRLRSTDNRTNHTPYFSFNQSKESIEFINNHTFSQIFRDFNLNDSEQAAEAVTLALEISADGSLQSLYSPGPHPALLLRVLEWAWGLPENAFGRHIRDIARSLLRENVKKNEGTPFGFIWRVASAATCIGGMSFPYEPVCAHTIAETYHWSSKESESPEASELENRSEDVAMAQQREASLKGQSRVRNAAIVCQRASNPADSVRYGSLRATIELGRSLLRNGTNVVMIGQGTGGLGVNEGGLFITVPAKRQIDRVVKLLEPLDLVVGISRADVVAMGRAKKYVIYHHNASPVDVHTLKWAVNSMGIPVAVVSKASKEMQERFGIKGDLLKVIPNGVDGRLFYSAGDEIRSPHSLMYAAHVVGTKGIDTALAAFGIIQRHFPDAKLDVYGKVFVPPNLDPRIMSRNWVTAHGFPMWEQIETDLPGFRYRGEVTQAVLAEAFRGHSVLVLPARLPEPLNLVCLEAQACGCIPVLPRVGGFPETMRENVTGYLYDENTREGLAEKIREIWSNDLPHEEQRKEAARWVKETFSWERAGREMLELIESLPSREHGPRIPFKGLLARIANMEREIGRLGRGARFAFTTLKKKSLSEWPAIVHDLWMEYARRRQIY